MKRQWKIILCLFIVLATLSSCSAPSAEDPNTFDEVAQDLGPANAVVDPAAQQPDGSAPQGGPSIFDSNPSGGDSIFASNPYEADNFSDGFNSEDPLNEENYAEDFFADNGVYDDGLYDDGSETNPYTYADPNATEYPYAGSTPIPLDPVDMPSPPPRTEIVFSYVPYTIAQMGIIFSGPAGWIPDESDSEIFVLTEPENQVKDGQPGILKIHAVPATADYNENALKTDIVQRLKEIGSMNYSTWDPSLTASRHLMGSKGIYANYSGTLVNGVKVGGRVHSASLNRMLYTIEITYPLEYKSDYQNIFNEMRSTIKLQ